MKKWIGYNIESVYQSLMNEYMDVIDNLSDLKNEMSDIDFYKQCQQLLFGFSGINFNIFYDILSIYFYKYQNILINLTVHVTKILRKCKIFVG